MTDSQPGGYAGDVSASAAFADLQRSPDATLVDVRTVAEWAYVGVPVLASIGKSPVMLEWDRFPEGGLVPDFVGRLNAELESHGIGRNAPLYFICRSGNRSRNAAILATAAGYVGPTTSSLVSRAVSAPTITAPLREVGKLRDCHGHSRDGTHRAGGDRDDCRDRAGRRRGHFAGGRRRGAG